jgi:hypothetical protein
MTTKPTLRAEDFTTTDLDDISLAGNGVAGVIADIAHHQIGEAGCWDTYGDGADELDRLRWVLTELATAIGESRRALALVERRARRRAARRTGSGA